jgi:hypothetical protein
MNRLRLRGRFASSGVRMIDRPLVCETCAATYHSKRLDSRFCSRACLGAANGARVSQQPRRWPQTACTSCGTVFQKLHETHVCCSRRCAAKLSNGGRSRRKPVGSAYWYVNDRGYIAGYVWTELGKRKVLQHRYFMEQHLGHPLPPEFDVHHKNEITTDNRLDNLEVLPHGEHSRLHGTGRRYPERKLTMEARAAQSARCLRTNVARGKGYRLNLTPEERMRRARQLQINKETRSRANGP